MAKKLRAIEDKIADPMNPKGKTYPISRVLTHPATAFIGGALIGRPVGSGLQLGTAAALLAGFARRAGRGQEHKKKAESIMKTKAEIIMDKIAAVEYKSPRQ